MYAETDITGEIQLAISYSDNENTLKVSINKVRGLTPPKDSNENSTNPYVAMVMHSIYVILYLMVYCTVKYLMTCISSSS